MFSGLIEGTGTIKSVQKRSQGLEVAIVSSFSLSNVKKGDSMAVNGCCLTVTQKSKNVFFAEISHETLEATHLGSVKSGTIVNLERPLRPSDRLGGHLVLGHVDTVGQIIKLKRKGISWEIEIQIPKKIRKYFISKGSVAVDGISMTVNSLTSHSFKLVVIPHTMAKTNLKTLRVGDRVNLEVDIIGKYIESFRKYG